MRDQMHNRIVTLVSVGNSLILDKKNKIMVEEILNRFLKGLHLLMVE